jgi:hypothetical protein
VHCSHPENKMLCCCQSNPPITKRIKNYKIKKKNIHTQQSKSDRRDETGKKSTIGAKAIRENAFLGSALLPPVP